MGPAGYVAGLGRIDRMAADRPHRQPIPGIATKYGRLRRVLGRDGRYSFGHQLHEGRTAAMEMGQEINSTPSAALDANAHQVLV